MNLRNLKITCVGITGITFLTFGIALLILWKTLFNNLLKYILILKPGSPLLDPWQKTPFDVPLDIYFFNWTNPEDIHNASKKLKFKEVGPYRFTEAKEKVNITWNSNGTVTYRLLRKWIFDEKGSMGKLHDQITTINAVSLSAAYRVKDWNFFLRKSFAITLSTVAPNIHVTKSARELLFDGFEDPLINMARTMPFSTDSLPPFDKFGWFYTRNMSYTFDGVFNMDTGGNGALGELRRWNYENQTKYFSGSCGKVHGSAAELYPQKLSRSNIGFFSPDMCRHVQLDYEKDVTIQNVKGYKFSSQSSMLDNGTLIPENKCYCNGQCVPSGMLNVSSCRYGTPAFVSLPHFYGADPMYLQMVEGLQPNTSKHEVYITIEPRTGLALDVAIRIQLNMLLQPIDEFTLYRDVPRVFFPILWFEQKLTIPGIVTIMIKILLSMPTVLPILGYFFTTTAIILLIISTGKWVIYRIFRYENTGISKEEVPLKGVKPRIRKQVLCDYIYS